MTMTTTPVGARVRLAKMLRELRRTDGRTLEEISEALERALPGSARSASTLSRLESGDRLRKPQHGLFNALLDVYGAPEDVRKEVHHLVEEARGRGWWHKQRGSLTKGYEEYLGYEGEAEILRTYEVELIPGLFQTAPYARAIIQQTEPWLDEQTVTERLQVRVERQFKRGLVECEPGSEPLSVWAIVGETALHKMVGGRQVMADQLQHLMDLSQLPNITLQVVPFTTGAHPGIGPFVIMSFREDLNPETVYADTAVGEFLVNNEEEVAGFRTVFEYLIEVALTTEETFAKISALHDDLSRKLAGHEQPQPSGMA